ncbi:unnamed protein product [Prunus armeniaca]
MHDVCNYDTYFVQKYDVVGIFGLLSEQKLTAALWMLAYGASKISTRGSTSANLHLGTSEGFYEKAGLKWKNFPTAWQGDYGNRKDKKSIILEAVASFDTWVWHAFLGHAGSQNDLNVLGQSSVFNDVLRGYFPQTQVYWELNLSLFPWKISKARQY